MKSAFEGNQLRYAIANISGIAETLRMYLPVYLDKLIDPQTLGDLALGSGQSELHRGEFPRAALLPTIEDLMKIQHFAGVALDLVSACDSAEMILEKLHNTTPTSVPFLKATSYISATKTISYADTLCGVSRFLSDVLGVLSCIEIEVERRNVYDKRNQQREFLSEFAQRLAE